MALTEIDIKRCEKIVGAFVEQGHGVGRVRMKIKRFLD